MVERNTPLASNPARELANILESWRDSGSGSVTAARANSAGAHPYDHAFWVGVDNAAVLVDQYRRVIDAMADEKKAIHRIHLTRLHELIYAPNQPWNQTKNAEFSISDVELASLRLAADSLDLLLPHVLDQDHADTIVGLLQESLELTDMLPQGVERDHLRQTIGLAIQFANDLDRFSGEAATVVATQVASDLQALAEDDRIDPETRSKFGRIWRDLLLQLGLNMGAGYGMQAISAGAEVIKSIAG